MRAFRFCPLGWTLLGLSLVALGTASAPAQDEDENPYRPGLVATYRAQDHSATRVDELLAFDWQAGAPDPRLPAGPFAVQWRGRLWTQSPGRHRLACYLMGQVEIRLGGQVVLAGETAEPQWIASPPLELPFDRHELAIQYRRTGPSARLALFWEGPDFRLEPILARYLMHDREQTPALRFERGRQLAAALRCGACHAGDALAPVPAPAIDRLSGNIERAWLVDWLAGQNAAATAAAARRMPHLPLSRDDAEAIADWLLREPAIKVAVKLSAPDAAKKSDKKKAAKKAKADEAQPPPPSAAEGQRLILTRGCLACHRLGELGDSGLLGGGDLARVAAKRPADFLLRWLSDPAAINRSHRMPQFSFTADELRSLALRWESQRKALAAPSQRMERAGPPQLVEGERLVAAHRCANCHLVRRDQTQLAQPAQRPLSAASDWSRACSGEPDRNRPGSGEREQAAGRPGYRLSAEEQAALAAYYSQPRPGEALLPPQARGRDLLFQLNCLACHQREGVEPAHGTPSAFATSGSAESGPATLQDKLAAVAAAHGDLAPLVPAMTPPALNSVGDKLHDAALAAAIRRDGPPHRPYLLVQMPKFALRDAQLADLVAYFVAADRIPERGQIAGTAPPAAVLTAAGPRLVTTDGLACTSCHQIGSVPPTKAPLNARGPDLSLLEKRIRREWFDRWCDNPARIVPRMEMPAVKVPVRGVLNDNVHDQLAAVWHILNTPGFEPPEPNPVRVLRLSGVPENNERPIVIHDVVKDGDKTYLYPLVIGLPNRHNILFDLETNRLAAWWLGDTARQRTKGKSWYWEPGAKPIFDPGFAESELTLRIHEESRIPEPRFQFAADLVRFQPDSATFDSRISLPATTTPIEHGGAPIEIRLRNTWNFAADGFSRRILLQGESMVSDVRLRLVGAQLARDCTWDELHSTLKLPGPARVQIAIFPPAAVHWNGDGSISLLPGALRLSSPGSQQWSATLRLQYSTALPVDRYLVEPLPPVVVNATAVTVAPGLPSRRLPIASEIMPTGFSWTAAGDLLVTTLKGEVLRARDSDQDGVEDTLHVVADGLATPYGVHAHADVIDVSAKDALVRLHDFDAQGRARRIERVAYGWGCTDDYHDWAVGLLPDRDGGYWIALPCQQDDRRPRAAAYRGQIIRVLPSPFARVQPAGIRTVSSGHRFPMGMAMNRDGELFVTDNQGNYNPFNELNHVRQGAHFGFINALEKQKGYQPPRHDPPAINIPHPWTRSVNGICFLETPTPPARSQSAPATPANDRPSPTLSPSPPLPLSSSPPLRLFGPLEGHLVGCEYDTRRLIRMSLQEVGDTYQGAAYPLSVPTDDIEQGLLGPIVCAVKPTTGELYVGEIRDSGWGAGNNIGQIVKIKIEPEKLPCGIAEMRATRTGFTLDFFQPVDRAKAASAASYSLSTYRRESTPAYGGPDLDRRSETIQRVEVAPDGKRVTLTLDELRPGYVYELYLQNLAPGGGMFHPAEAHYTLHRIPE